MTVFVRVLKEIILNTLERIEDQSIAADYIPFYFRDSDFSKKQRALFDPLKKAISDFSAQSILDPVEASHHKSLTALLQNTLTDLGTLHNDSGHSRGYTYSSLQKLINSMQELYNELLNFKTKDGKFTLLGLIDDQSPYNKLAYWSLYYLTSRALGLQGSVIKVSAQKTINFMIPAVASERIQEAKKRCLKIHLSDCFTLVNAISDDLDLSIRTTGVLDKIQRIKTDNTKICSENGIGLSLPFSIISPFSFFTMNFSTKPGEGLLQTCMEEAEKSIQPSQADKLTREPVDTATLDSRAPFSSSFSSTHVSDRVFSSSFPPSLKQEAETPTTDLPASPASPRLEF